MAKGNNDARHTGANLLLAASALVFLAAVLGQAAAQSSMSDYQACISPSTERDARIFVCSRIIGDAAQPPDIRSQALEQRARAYLGKNAEDRALTDLTEAIRLDPKNDWAYRTRALLYEEKKDYGRSIADHTERVRVKPSFDSYMERAIAYQAKGDFDNAIKDYSEALRLNAEAFGIFGLYLSRGEAYKAKGDRERAIADYRKHLELVDPKADSVKEILKGLGAQ
jgi:tetratricopeptide (TPR) repeat protein